LDSSVNCVRERVPEIYIQKVQAEPRERKNYQGKSWHYNGWRLPGIESKQFIRIFNATVAKLP
jgi:hypothetical protein